MKKVSDGSNEEKAVKPDAQVFLIRARTLQARTKHYPITDRELAEMKETGRS